MNGKTLIDGTLNPCTADMDRHTWGWGCLNITFRGHRLFRVGVFGVHLDIYWSGWKRPFSARYSNGAILFFPGGSLSWPREGQG